MKNAECPTENRQIPGLSEAQSGWCKNGSAQIILGNDRITPENTTNFPKELPKQTEFLTWLCFHLLNYLRIQPHSGFLSCCCFWVLSGYFHRHQSENCSHKPWCWEAEIHEDPRDSLVGAMMLWPVSHALNTCQKYLTNKEQNTQKPNAL